MSEITKNVLIEVYGMRRSGIHTIRDWVLTNGFPNYRDLTEYPRHNNVYAPQHIPPRDRKAADLRVETDGERSKLAIVYEDTPLGEIPYRDSVRNAHQIIENAAIYRIIILRDPFNMFASRLQMVREDTASGKASAIRRIPMDDAVRTWKEYAKEFISEGEALKDISPGGIVIPIEYGKWTKDREYRDSLMRTHFGQENNLDLGKENIPEKFESTWEGRRFDGNASQMITGDRWQQMNRDSEYLSIFRDRELLALAEHPIFEPVYDIEQLLDIRPSSEGEFRRRGEKF